MSNSASLALRNSKKGQSNHKCWDTRYKEVLNEEPKIYITVQGLAVIKQSDISLDKISTPQSKTPKIGTPEIPTLLLKEESSDIGFDSFKYLELLSEREMPIVEYERQRFLAGQELYEKKKAEYENFFRTVEQEYKMRHQQLIEQQNQKHEESMAKFFSKEPLSLEEPTENSKISKDQNLIKNGLKQKSSINQNNFSEKFKHTEAEKPPEVEMKETENNQELSALEQTKLRQDLLSLHNHFEKSILPQIVEKLNSCKGKQYLQTSFEVSVHHIEEVVKLIEQTVTKSASQVLDLNVLSHIKNLIEEAEKQFRTIAYDVDQANTKAIQESLKPVPKEQSLSPSINNVSQGFSTAIENNMQAETAENSLFKLTLQSPQNSFSDTFSKNVPEVMSAEEVQVVDMEEADITTDVSEQPSVLQEEQKTQSFKNEEKKQLEIDISNAGFKEYFSCIENLKNAEETVQPFLTNSKNKKYKLELHKAVTGPINAIAACTGSHLKDKINRLISLLAGQTVACGEKYTSCKQDPLAELYCKKLVAEKAVNQGEEEIASRFDTAFPIAAVVVAVCSKFPDVWQLILGYFYTKCPYLVPYYPPREEGQPDAEYYTSLGYKYISGELENKDKFLKRMSGFMRLYAAILLTPSPPGFPPAKSHGLEHGWMWIARTLNMDPRPHVTVTLLFDMLDVLGYFLDKTYGQQFKKLLYVLSKEYLEKAKKVSPPGSGGPISRLENFLLTAFKKRQLPRPEGVLSANFWRT